MNDTSDWYVWVCECFNCASHTHLLLVRSSLLIVFHHLQYSRPLTLVKETIQTRNRKSTGKSKKKGKKTVLAHLPLTPPLSAGLITEGASGNNVFSNQLSPCNYILSAPSASYEQPLPQHYADYSYTPVSFASATGYSPAQHHMYSGEGKQQREEYVCEDATYRRPEGMVEIKPNITATTTAAPPHYVAHTGTGHQVTRAEPSMDTNMTATFHASTYSAFSPFASNHSSPLVQSPSQGATTHSPLL